jgi:putative transposase
MRYRFIAQYRKQFPITALCRVMQVSTSGYYAWRSRPESRRSCRNRALLVHIKAEHARSRKTYGWRRIHIEVQKKA